MTSVVEPRSVCYIKLGEGGGWERECLERGIMRFGFGTQEPEKVHLSHGGKWPELAASFVTSGRSKG
jgi:hypothetical protein